MFATWDIALAVTAINTDMAPLFADAMPVILATMLGAWAFKQVRKFGFTSAG